MASMLFDMDEMLEGGGDMGEGDRMDRHWRCALARNLDKFSYKIPKVKELTSSLCLEVAFY